MQPTGTTRRQRGLRDAEQLPLELHRILLSILRSFSSTTETYSKLSPRISDDSPGSLISTLRNICRTITSMFVVDVTPGVDRPPGSR
jgi:hypothetical protein